MTAPPPAPRLSPTAGLFNTLVRHLNRRLRLRIAELTAAIETGGQQPKGGAQ